MKVLRLIVLISLFSFSTGFGSSSFTPGPGRAFQDGETLKYVLFYGLLNGGEAIMSVEAKKHEEKDVLHAVAMAYTTGLADKLFAIFDVYESFMDPVTGLPHKAIRNISEGRYKFYDEVLYDRERNVVNSQRKGEVPVPEGIQDMVSGFYNLRRILSERRPVPNEVIEIETYFADEIYPLKIRYNGQEIIKTRMGRFRSLKFSPVTEPGRLFKTEDDITIWISDDANYLPLRIRVNFLVGALKCDLIEYSGLANPMVPLR
jgi:hypothetical protein